MPSAAAATEQIPSQPVDKHPPKAVDDVLAEKEAKWIFSEDELAHTPSILDGWTKEHEWHIRYKGLTFIMQVGIVLKLPQLTLSTAGIYFNRFLTRYSLVSKPEFKALHHYQVGAIALFLATKTEENSRRMKDIVVACIRVARKEPDLIVDEQDPDYWKWRDSIIFHEDVMLELLCFDLTAESPHKQLFDLLKRLAVEHNKRLRNAAWAFVNDSCLTCMCLLFPSKVIAAAAVYCAVKHVTGTCGEVVNFAPEFDVENGGKPWWNALQTVDMHNVKRATNFMADIHQPSAGSSQGQQQSLEQHKAGASGGEASIYANLHTPLSDDGRETRSTNGGFGRARDNGDDDHEGTFDRLRLSSNAPQTPGTPVVRSSPPGARSLDRPPASAAGRDEGSERGVKRDRDGTSRAWGEADAGASQTPGAQDEEGEVARNGHGDSPQKKPRIETNGVPAAAAKPEDETGSEEGEVEG